MGEVCGPGRCSKHNRAELEHGIRKSHLFLGRHRFRIRKFLLRVSWLTIDLLLAAKTRCPIGRLLNANISMTANLDPAPHTASQ
jgi:hypothetical protein